MKIFKWILTVVCFIFALLSMATVYATGVSLYWIVSLIAIVLGIMACPKITAYTSKYKIYTKFKWLIVVILIIIQICTLMKIGEILIG